MTSSDLDTSRNKASVSGLSWISRSRNGRREPDDGFAMVYETGKAATRTLGAVARALKGAESLVLATDPDREGEAIAWQVLT